MENLAHTGTDIKRLNEYTTSIVTMEFSIDRQVGGRIKFSVLQPLANESIPEMEKAAVKRVIQALEAFLKWQETGDPVILES